MSVQDLLDSAVTTGAMPGAVAVTVGAEGVEEVTAAGISPDTIFRYASMTKVLTSVATLQLAERGELSLDHDVASLVPDFGDLQVLEGFDGDRPLMRAPAAAATVRQLLNHTAGNGYFFTNETLKRYIELTGTPGILTGLRASLTQPLIADPGAIWEYGVNTDWAGLVVEAVSGMDLAAYLAQNVLEPLGLESMSFSPTAEQRERMIPIHHRTAAGTAEPGELELPETPEFWPGGHGLHGTAADYGRFLAALLGDGELDGARILAPESVALMFTDSLGGIALPEVMRSADPEFTNDVPSFPVSQGWGLGLHLVLDDLPGMRRAGTGDWAGIFNCYYWVDRASGLAAAIFTQLLPFFDDRVIETVTAFEQSVYAELGVPAS